MRYRKENVAIRWQAKLAYRQIFSNTQWWAIEQIRSGGKDTGLNVIQITENIDSHNKRPTQSTANKALNKKEHHRQI